MKNFALASNGAIATADSYEGNNVPSNVIDGNLEAGNGYNWYGGTKIMISLKQKERIEILKIKTTDLWGYSYGTFNVYYSLEETANVNDDI